MGRMRFSCAIGLILVLIWVHQDSRAQGDDSRAQGDAQLLFFDGFDLMKSGKMTEAAASFEDGLRLEPDSALAHFFLAESYVALGQTDQALTHYRESLRLEPMSGVSEQAKQRLGALAGSQRPGRVQEKRPAGADHAGRASFKACDVCQEVVIVPAEEAPAEAGQTAGPSFRDCDVCAASPFPDPLAPVSPTR